MPQSNKVQLKVVQKSAFPGKAHFSSGTAKVGSLVPIMFDELIPNTTVDVKMAIAASLPPLAADTYMNVDYCVEAFFVPMRLCYAGLESFFTQNPDNQIYANSDGVQVGKAQFVLPRVLVNFAEDSDGNSDADFFASPHTLFDYFNYWVDDSLSGSSGYVPINPLHYVAYNLIWDNWYRNTLVQRSAFAKPAGWNTDLNPSSAPFVTLPYSSYNVTYGSISLSAGELAETSSAANSPGGTSIQAHPSTCFADGHPFWWLRQRNFGYDYFTNSWPNPQLGTEPLVTPDAEGRISISGIRGANSLKQWEEVGLFCPRLTEACHARYGAHLADSIAQRPICLGSARYPVYSKSIDVQGSNSGNINPMSATAGSQVARGYATGTEHIIDSFTAQEPGYLFILGSLVPSVVYSTGVDRINTRYMYNLEGQRVEMADPMLQNTGNQPIFKEELDGVIPLVSGFNPVSRRVFSYTDRYADFMVKRNSTHGLLRLTNPNGTSYALNMFAAQRAFSGQSAPSMGSAFLEIPTNYLDNVTAVRSQLSSYGYWYECGFMYRVSQPLADYSVPSLQNPAYEHGDTVTVHRGGFRF